MLESKKNVNKVLSMMVVLLFLCSGCATLKNFFAKTDPNHIDSALREYDRGNYEKAVKFYSLAINNGNNTYEAYFNRGISYKSLGRMSDALGDFLRAFSIRPADSGQAALQIAETYFQMQDYSKALEYAEKVLALNSSHKPMRRIKGHSLFFQKDYVIAAEILASCSDSLSKKTLALCYFKLRKPEKARDIFMKQYFNLKDVSGLTDDDYYWAGAMADVNLQGRKVVNAYWSKVSEEYKRKNPKIKKIIDNK
ncbi:MAG: tetratricopeptide repeat protein [Verrucomicrobiota bacterium]|nr:tetratricopeptide repeat protein [Verrucomicrobiota bacterium]